MSTAYFRHKRAPHLAYLTCKSRYDHGKSTKNFIVNGMRVSVTFIDEDPQTTQLDRILVREKGPVGVLLNAGCPNVPSILQQASRHSLFDAMHMWLILDSADAVLEMELQQLNLSVNADVVVARSVGTYIELIDYFNYGKIQGNSLEIITIGKWHPKKGLSITSNRFKYYDRWNFNNLTLRAVTVILDKPTNFRPTEMLSSVGYSAGVAVMTKIATQQLDVLKEKHNFRFNYTIAGRWIGSPERNSTLAVTNSLYWREQDISCTCARIFPQWLNWVDVFYPPTTKLETKFYYLILDKGVGKYENRFLSPLSPGVWRCAIAAVVACGVLLAAAAMLERHSEPGSYAFFSVFAVICQQAFEDGIIMFEETFSSQGRRLILTVVGITSMLLYNYYTSSVVSWLLSAAAPTLQDLDALVASDLELVFEDIGYSRQWLDNPGFYYFSGFKNPKEDILRERKVTRAKRSVKLLQDAEAGIQLIRSGEYAYHTEPYTAYQVISRTFDDRALCELGALQMMRPASVYIMAQKNSPYKEFFVWSLLRLLERGHTSAARARVSGSTPMCSGRTPRALALGQAAPAFAVLGLASILAVVILACEIIHHRYNNIIMKKQVAIDGGRRGWSARAGVGHTKTIK
ncbi:ionotropic receptor 75a-like [Aricia agestis]|uniref:ionotropic receptor 75a-like n=1 Tax=Aricia agestis TaxID=91739 RepID=UPI001C204767|nr:ionotropic receptor 75a-like [Aricia agestis]